MVKKIFILLITIVALIAIGALVLNVVLPNGTSILFNTVEGSIYNATGMNFDINGDGKTGKTNASASQSGDINDDSKYTNDDKGGGNVQGFQP